MLARPFIAAVPRLGAEDAQVASTQRAELLESAAEARARIVFSQAEAGDRGAALSAEAERHAPALVTGARERGNADGAEDLIQMAASVAVRRPLARKAWSEAERRAAHYFCADDRAGAGCAHTAG